MRRLRRVFITGEFFVRVMRDGLASTVVVENALPRDCALVGSTFDPASLCVCLIVESASFNEVPESAVIPEHPPVTFRRLDA